ncbi:hypothetical protein FKP32DRAFT_1580835 [Trametes sanguinea]|nr:hypothetical protein FKP32DRAFT_1580835 [Trametes sanguinea]
MPQKRARTRGPKGDTTSGASGRRAVGRLAGLMHIPMDVFFEILSMLHPQDLLHLSRASKQLRAVVLSRKCRFVWAASLASVDGLPPCPEDMSEPAYAALLFTHICTLCGATHAVWVDYAIRLRLCKSCRDANIKSGGRILTDEPALPPDPELLYVAMVPCVTGKDPYAARELENPLSHTLSNEYYVSQLQAALKHPIPHPKEGQETEEWLNSFCANAIARHKHATALLRWEKCMLSIAKREGRKIKDNTDSFSRSVIGKLNQLGYNRDDFPDSVEWRRLLNQRKTLTDRNWNTLRPKLEGLIQERRREKYEFSIRKDVERRKEQIATFYEEMVRTLSEEDQRLMPGAFDACQLPCLVALARRDDAKGDVLLEDLQPLAEQVIREAEVYKDGAKESAVEQIMDAAKWQNRMWLDDMEGLTPDEVLKRPYALFRCRPCRLQRGGEYKTFEDMHAHFRTTHPRLSWRSESIPVNTMFECVASYFTCANILEAVGLPRDTPHGVLSELVKTGRLYCSCRDPGLPPPEELDWPKLVSIGFALLTTLADLSFPPALVRAPNQNVVIKETHPCLGPDVRVKLIPEGVDTSPARERATLIDPSIRARIEARLASRPQPTAIPLCGVCTKFTRKYQLRNGGERIRGLPESPEGIVHHLREWHEKDFEEKDIVFFVDGQLAVEQ